VSEVPINSTDILIEVRVKKRVIKERDCGYYPRENFFDIIEEISKKGNIKYLNVSPVKLIEHL
jgi:hypothetical protein